MAAAPPAEVPDVVDAAHDGGFLGMNEEDEKFAKEVVAKIAVSTVSYPLLSTKTLIQLGYEPFPLSTGKTMVVAGRNAYFLPNFFSYAYQMASEHPSGNYVLFTGLDSAIFALIAGRYAARATARYLDEHIPDLGGKAEFEGKDERELTDHQSFRHGEGTHCSRMLRAATRDSAVRIVTVFVARPFTVVCIRQIAQLISGECKYINTMQALRLIGREEGPGGLFSLVVRRRDCSGFVPQLVAELVMVWGVHSLVFAAERTLVRSGLDKQEEKDDKGEKDFLEARRLVTYFAPHVISSFSSPYSVVSTVMACVGSGLAVSFLPYNPSFSSWQDCYDYLRPHGLKRGSRMFLREQTGAISVGTNKQLYASNKHFA